MGKIRSVWCKGVQCSTMGEFKKIWISSLKYIYLLGEYNGGKNIKYKPSVWKKNKTPMEASIM
jgi:hypothetical protein